jgi:hypothetical protein
MKKLFGHNKPRNGKPLVPLTREIITQEVSNIAKCKPFSSRIYASYRNLVYPHQFISNMQHLQNPLIFRLIPFGVRLATRSDGKSFHPKTRPNCVDNIIHPLRPLVPPPLHHFPLAPHPRYQAPTRLDLRHHSAYPLILPYKQRN